MAIEFKRDTIPFPSASGKAQTKSKKFSFSATVLKAEAAIKGFSIGFSNGEHPLYRQKVDLDVTVDSNKKSDVWVTANFALRDASGTFDDPFDGEVEVLVIAQTEEMEIVPYIRGTEKVLLRTNTNNMQYVSAEAGEAYKLMATKRSPGDEERFTIELVDSLKNSRLTDRSRIILVASNDKLVCAEGGGGRELIANRSEIGPWETFTIRKLATDYKTISDDGIAYGDRIALLANNGQIVCAENGGRRQTSC